MKGKEFTKRVKKYAKANNIAFELTSQGKGGHQTIHLGSKRTTVKTGEIKQGLLNAMCKQLGIKKEDL
tara:strand:+ start:592 stop:795 length:204 start_codon:yes stop_codon:yes gene_type:complete